MIKSFSFSVASRPEVQIRFHAAEGVFLSIGKICSYFLKTASVRSTRTVFDHMQEKLQKVNPFSVVFNKFRPALQIIYGIYDRITFSS